MEGTSKTREVYLPRGGWYDFWTKQFYEGGQIITIAAPINIIPLFVKAGSILPMTQSMQYVDELPQAPIDLYVYPGKDSEFVLYEDEGNSYRYEEGEYALTRINWFDQKQELIIHEPNGHYEGMVKDREYRIHIIKNI